MRYHINQENYHTFTTFRVNKLPARSYFIPYPTRCEANDVKPKEKRYRSSKVICLNGKWDFKFYPYPAVLGHNLDTDRTEFDTIDVPSCWQFRGYDKPFYVNVRYQFPYNPPDIPKLGKVGKVFSWIGFDQKIGPRFKDPGDQYNFIGVYRKKFDISDASKKHIISFMGVASCIDLYVNGTFVGYSEGSHNTAEFDLTEFLVEGENELLAIVHRWCNGTYLESQDMFRNNGIFRDVLLYVCENEDIWDIDAVTKKTPEGYALRLSVKTFADTGVKFSLKGNGIDLTERAMTKNCRAEVNIPHLNVREWNDDTPVLYELFFETKTCCIKEKIGFRTVQIKNDVFLVNGSRIKFHGVNHHETSPINGYTMTPDEIERDIKLCKDFNIDMIRTSHYPPDPLLLELCDEYGIYVIDENDLETHGVYAHKLPPSYNRISQDVRWKSHYLDRIRSLYERDKMHSNTSIVMWSLGNEAGGYRNTDVMYDYIKGKSSLPVHYENVIHSKRQAYDVGSEMYPSVEKVRAVGMKKRGRARLNDRPYFMCEYAHAMGNGPGNIESYWKEIYKYDNLMGGCVWEMVDHAVLEENGDYTYGGDHGEWEHDGNFCVDGLFYPDRTPSTGAYIVKHIYRPLRVSLDSPREITIFNTRSFGNGKKYTVNLIWEDGTEKSLPCDVDPLMHRHFYLDKENPLVAVVREKSSGKVISKEQLCLKAQVITSKELTKVSGECGFEINNGRLVLSVDGRPILVGNMQGTLLYRAPTDNDSDLRRTNHMLPYTKQKEEVQKIVGIPGGYAVLTKITNEKNEFVLRDTYEQTDKGILVTSILHSINGNGVVPRFGKCFRLSTDFDDVAYNGRSGETYCDMRDHFVIEEVDCKVSDMTEPNIRPQESGNRCDCSWAEISDQKTKIRFSAVDAPFELAIKPYSDEALCKMRHRSDEIRTGTYVTIEAFQQGIGTGACGPGIAPEYTYPADRDYILKFLISVDEE